MLSTFASVSIKFGYTDNNNTRKYTHTLTHTITLVKVSRRIILSYLK